MPAHVVRSRATSRQVRSDRNPRQRNRLARRLSKDISQENSCSVFWMIVQAVLPACYEQFQKRQRGKLPKVSTFSVQFDIDAAGEVAHARMQSKTFRDVETKQCVEKNARTWVFPKPRGNGPLRVEFPFHFTSVASVQPTASKKGDHPAKN